jgi:hypothetical protein
LEDHQILDWNVLGFDNKMEQLCANFRRAQKNKAARQQLTIGHAESPTPPSPQRQLPASTAETNSKKGDDGLQPQSFNTGDWITLKDGNGIPMAHGTCYLHLLSCTIVVAYKLDCCGRYHPGRRAQPRPAAGQSRSGGYEITTFLIC